MVVCILISEVFHSLNLGTLKPEKLNYEVLKKENILVDTNMEQCCQKLDFSTANKSLVPCGDKPSPGFVETHPELPLTSNAATDVGKNCSWLVGKAEE